MGNGNGGQASAIVATDENGCCLCSPIAAENAGSDHHCHCYSYNCHGNSSSPATNPTLSQLHTDTDIMATLDTG